MSSFIRRWGAGICTLALICGLGGCGITPTPFGQSQATSATSVEPDAKKEESTTTATGTTQPESVPVNVGGENYMTVETDEAVATPYVDYTDYNTEEYAKVEESGFVATRTTPLSTVSADVDTASYSNLRRMLRQGYKVQDEKSKEAADAAANTGYTDSYSQYPEDWYYEQEQIIPTGAVRIEEMLNYFTYGYEVPSKDAGFAVTARMGACPWNKDTDLLVLGYSTPAEDASVREKGTNLVFLIDVSGSMDDADKLPLLQSSFGELVDQLGENDKISIVTYSGSEQVVLEAESGKNHQEIMRAIRSLHANGSTNGEAGLRMAYEIASKNFIEGGVNRIVLASDGDLNVGMTSESDLHDYVEKQRESGVYLSVLGFGAGNYKDTKMETLADNGNGSYHYIDCEDEAKRVFGEKLCANLVPFANDVKMQVEFNPAQIKGYRLVGYENRTMAAEDFKNDEKDAGEVGPENQFTVVYEVVRANSAMEIPTSELKYEQPNTATSNADEWATVKLRYKPLGKTDAQEQEVVLSQSNWQENPGEDWRFAAAVTEFGMILRNSEFKGTSTYKSVRELVGETKDEQRLGFLELVDLAEKN